MKVLAGDWKKETPVNAAFGVLQFQTGIFSFENVQMNQISSFNVLTEENKASI